MLAKDELRRTLVGMAVALSACPAPAPKPVPKPPQEPHEEAKKALKKLIKSMGSDPSSFGSGLAQAMVNFSDPRVFREAPEVEEGCDSVAEVLATAELPKVLSPLPYPGSKRLGIRFILPFIPVGEGVLCSPFFGAGSLELACAKLGMQVFGYDLHEPIVNFWKVILSQPEDLAREVARYPRLSQDQFKHMKQNYPYLKDPVKKAAYEYVTRIFSYAATGLSFSDPKPSGEDAVGEGRLERIRSFSAPNVAVGIADFHESIPHHSEHFLYCDPPYLTEHPHLYGWKGELHKGFDHVGLAELLLGRDRWVLSYNDHPAIRRLYKGCRFQRAEWNYSIKRGENYKGKELIIRPPKPKIVFPIGDPKTSRLASKRSHAMV